MGCIQSSEGKSQDQRDTSSGMNKNHVKTEGLITTFGDTQRSTYTRHPEEDSSEGNGSHMGTCGYDNSPDSDNEKGHSLNLLFSPNMSMQMYDDEAPNINYRPCDSDKAILYDTSSDSDDKFIIKEVTSDKHSSSPTQLTATTPDMSLQISSRRYHRASFRNSPNMVKTNDPSSEPKEPKYPLHHARFSSSCRWYVRTQRKASHKIYSYGDSDEDTRYKKIITENHLPNPRPDRPRAPPAPPPPDHLN